MPSYFPALVNAFIATAAPEEAFFRVSNELNLENALQIHPENQRRVANRGAPEQISLAPSSSLSGDRVISHAGDSS